MALLLAPGSYRPGLLGLGAAAREDVADVRDACLPAPRRQSGAEGGRGVGQAQDQAGRRRLAQVAEKAKHRPFARLAALGELHRPEVLLDEQGNEMRLAGPETEALAHRLGGAGAFLGVAEEADAAAGVRGLGLGLGDVVQE